MSYLFILSHVTVVQVRYYTDPACPWSWALEPALRKLMQEFAGALRFRYVMCGMLREGADPRDQARQTLEAAEKSGMPVDVRLWLDGAPASSYPACIAVKAAAEQGDPGPYLRRLREGLLCRRRKLDTGQSLVEEARACGELDVERFRIALASHATLEAFGADLELASGVDPEHRADGSGRVRLPSLEFLAEDGETVRGVYGFSDYAALREGALSAGAEAPSSAGGAPAVEEALRRFGAMATAEVASVCELPGPRAPAELWRLAVEWRVKPERVGSGELWSPG
jgi:predicted DsbA family dithiol-disulfide isomerase